MTQFLGPVMVYVDLELTRRRRAHEVITPDGQAVFHAQTVGDLLSWLHEHGHSTFKVIDGDTVYYLQMGVLPPDP